jgi:hypothetical protein
VLNADTPDALREAVKHAYVEVLEKLSERTRGASPSTVIPDSRSRAASRVAMASIIP